MELDNLPLDENSLDFMDKNLRDLSLLNDEIPEPIFASTAHKVKRNVESVCDEGENTNIPNADFRGSYAPREQCLMWPNSQSDESSLSSNFRDDSSLSALDLNAMPDARKSVSLVHVTSKCSSIGSWLDQCFDDDSKHPGGPAATSSQFNLHPTVMSRFDDHEKFLEVECQPESDDSDNEFNGDIDFDIPVQTELDETMKGEPQDGDIITEQTDRILHDAESAGTTTSDFLQRITFPQTPSTLKVPAGGAATFSASPHQQQQSTSMRNAFDNWQCTAPLEFSGIEFEQDSRLQQQLFGSENFLESDALHIMDQEEKLFEEQNHLKLEDNFAGKEQSSSNVNDFSDYRTSMMSEQTADELGKVSIGAYMAIRSCKLGDLGGDVSKERPSFGLKIKTPSPKKPFNLADATKLSALDPESTLQETSVDTTITNANSILEKNFCSLSIDETVDQSMMSTLSKAISEMSTSMNNEELAKLIIALSNKKIEEKQQTQSKERSLQQTKDDLNEAPSSVVNSFESRGESLEKSAITSLRESDVYVNNKLVENEISISKTVPSDSSQRQQPIHGRIDHNEACDEVFPLPNHENTISSDFLSRQLLSSTRSNLSLTRGSLSRESIEELHKKLRMRGRATSTESGFDQDLILPDVVSNRSSIATRKSTMPFPILSDDQTLKDSPVNHMVPPVSRSSLCSDEMMENDVNLTRLSSAFHQLIPSTSFSEMMTIAESEIDDHDNATGHRHLTTIEESRSSVESISSKEESLGSDSVRLVPSAHLSHLNTITHFSSLPAMYFNQPLLLQGGPLYHGHPIMRGNHPSQQASSTGHYMDDSRAFDTALCAAQSQGVDISYPHMLPCQHLPAMRGMNIVSQPALVLPSQVEFDETLCVGIPATKQIPLRNSTSRWMQVELRTLSVTINHCDVMIDIETLISMKTKHIIGPNSTEVTDVVVNGCKPGRFIITIKAESMFIAVEGIQPLDPRFGSSQMSICANVEAPAVSVFAGSDSPKNKKRSESADFGDVFYGSTKSLPIRILNEGKAETAVRIVFWSSFHDRSSFSLSMSSTYVKDSDTGARNTLHKTLPVSIQPLTVWLHFHPSFGRASLDEKPTKVDGQVEVILASPIVPNLSLDSVPVSALLGVGKLHAPKSQQLLSFQVNKGRKQSKTFPVKNAGNLPVQVAFAPDNHSEIFSVKPTTALLTPGGHVELTVECSPPLTFEPTRVGEELSALIVMNILPTGPQFEVNVTAVVLKTSESVQEGPGLLTNKTSLRWGGVSVGQSSKQKLMLKCREERRVPTTVRASVKGDGSSFQILTTKSGSEELCKKCDRSIQPGLDETITLLFAPTRKQMVRAKLEIKTPIDELPTTKYTIPLVGYGGSSEVVVDGLQRSEKKPTLLFNDNVCDVYEMPAKENWNMRFTLANRGCRIAFVKILLYNDSNSMEKSSLTCTPDQFVLRDRSSRVIYLKSASRTSKSPFICIWHGDELSRQLLKLSLSHHSSLVARCVPKSFSFLRKISFDETFDGEDASSEEDLTSFESHPSDVQLFFNNLRMTKIEVVPSTSHDTQQRLVDLSPSSGVKPKSSHVRRSLEPERDVGLFVAESSKPKLSTQPRLIEPLHENPPTTTWDVSPTHITLDVPPPDLLGKLRTHDPVRVKIINRSVASLLYDVMWPGHYLTITPNRGCVEPESVAVVLVSANPSLATKKNIVPWCGQVMFVATCGGPGGRNQSKTIYVQIKQNTSKPSQDAVLAGVKMEKQSLNDVAICEEKISLKIAQKSINFEDVVIGKNAMKQLEFRNMSKIPLSWVLASLSPPYVKAGTGADSGKIFRSTYAAFVFSHKSGQLEPGASAQIPVTFNPFNVGTYSQHWELQFHVANDNAAFSLNKEKIELHGQATTPKVVESYHKPPPTTTKSDIFISDHFLFPDTVVGKSSIIKIPIKNKGKSPQTVQFINIRPPFHITHQRHTIRAMHCANLPVTFQARSKGTYTGSLVVQTDARDSSDNLIRVTVTAKAVE
ncbi:unnamed protein product [Clavelina lepadiformis]|uniref:Centrosomal protein of 192 kDa n=1 Tax=Clavelina lepadiformis TaxID=159417 RepID=A0ABP0G6L7_CLALP